MKTLFLLTYLLLTTIAQAGTPADDFTVALLQDRYKNAKVPTEADLQLEQVWKCMTYDARAGIVDVEENQRLKLFKFDGIILSKIPAEVPAANAIIDPVNTMLPTSFVFTKFGLVSTMSRPTDFKRKDLLLYNTIRVDAAGNLLSEWSIKGLSSETENILAKNFAPAVTFDHSYATAYSVCAKEAL